MTQNSNMEAEKHEKVVPLSTSYITSFFESQDKYLRMGNKDRYRPQILKGDTKKRYKIQNKLIILRAGKNVTDNDEDQKKPKLINNPVDAPTERAKSQISHDF